MYDRNQEIVGPETIVFNNKEIIVPGMDEDELAQFVQEGNEVGNINIEVNGETISLINMADGRRLFKRLEAMNLKDVNMTAFWYVWREARMAERLAKLPEERQAQILAIINQE